MLWPIELRSQRRRLESNQLEGRLQLPASPVGIVVNCFLSKHAVQGSNLPPPDLESGIPPLKNFRRMFSLVGFASRTVVRTANPTKRAYMGYAKCAGRDSNPRRPWASSSTGCRNCRSATYAIFSVSVEGFEPSTPCARGTCAAKLRYTLRFRRFRCANRFAQRTLQHSRRDSNSRSPTENRKSCRLDDGSKFVHRRPMLPAGIEPASPG